MGLTNKQVSDKRYYKAHKKESIARACAWNKKNKKQRTSICKRWREYNPDYTNKLRKRKPGCRIPEGAKYRVNNKKEIKARMQTWLKNNRAKRLETSSLSSYYGCKNVSPENKKFIAIYQLGKRVLAGKIDKKLIPQKIQAIEEGRTYEAYC